jgi:hypothetical protein
MMSRTLRMMLAGLALAASCVKVESRVCKQDAECQASPNDGVHLICVNGQCEQCHVNNDCGPFKLCRSQRCVSSDATQFWTN